MRYARPEQGQSKVEDRHEAVLVWFCTLTSLIVIDSETSSRGLDSCAHTLPVPATLVRWGPWLRIGTCSSDLPLPSVDLLC